MIDINREVPYNKLPLLPPGIELETTPLASVLSVTNK